MCQKNDGPMSQLYRDDDQESSKRNIRRWMRGTIFVGVVIGFTTLLLFLAAASFCQRHNDICVLFAGTK